MFLLQVRSKCLIGLKVGIAQITMCKLFYNMKYSKKIGILSIPIFIKLCYS